MPPKKKTKTRDASSPAAADSPATPSAAATSTMKEVPAAEPVISDGWTDEQETTLFKAISVYNMKPAGMHKHFRMIAIAELMKNHGVADKHTNIPGIWAKLRTLYNLEGLDEREDISEDGHESHHYTDFRLPPSFEPAMMARRFASTSHSPSVSPPPSGSPPPTEPTPRAAATPKGGAGNVDSISVKRTDQLKRNDRSERAHSGRSASERSRSTLSPSASSLALTESGVEDTEEGTFISILLIGSTGHKSWERK
ncbi:CT20-domain-containing protein [Ascobolus immersus RN42]|uniref:CT20-domain-containing protein n=1 Tax=Ascobolus immersus RN42 TaxID=1160509 RepID=A0A3N4HXP3_ASCIM|nr:CT20-domain-containing protein [Ascobolus immersus RN42]